MILYFADRKTMDIAGHASTELLNGFSIIGDSKIEDVDTGTISFEATIAFDEGNRLDLENMAEVGNYLLRSSGDENEFYTIVEAEIDTKNHEVWIYAEDAGLDLINEIAEEFAATSSQPITYYINKWISDSGFEIGLNECPDSTTRKLTWTGESTVTERLASIANQFGGYEISYSFAVNGMVVTNRYVNIHKQRGKDVGEPLRINKEIDRIVTKKSITNLATALKCTGGLPENKEKPITLSGYSYDDGDFYVSGSTLYSRNASEKWGRFAWAEDINAKHDGRGFIVRQYSYDTLSQSTLCSHAIAELKKLCDMEVNYEVDITNMPDSIKVGDRINVIDDAGELYLSTRILQLKTSEVEQKKEAVLGEYLIKESGISQTVEDLAAQFKEVAAIRAAALEAQNKADEVGTAITEVEAKANAAQETADKAVTDAETAQETATKAKSDAAAAQTSAEKANEKIDALKAKAITTDNLSAKVATLGYATVEQLTAANADITNLKAKDAEIEGTLTAATADITDLKAKAITTDNLSAKVGEFGYLKADDLEAEVAEFGYAKIKDLDTNYARIDQTNINQAWVIDLMVTGNFLADDINATTGSFSKWLTGVNIVGDMITGGTIATERLIIRDPETNKGILYEINNGVVDQTKLSEEELKRLCLDGKILVAESVTADKINVADLFSQNITATGNFNLGEGGALVYDADTDTLTIRAKEILLTSGLTVEDAVQSVKNSTLIEAYDEYATSDSAGTEPMEWSTDKPTAGDGIYIWQRRANVYGNGDIVYGPAVCITGSKGDAGKDATNVRIYSSKGTVFKNNTASTVLSVAVFRGGERITDISALKSAYGSTAYLQWSWIKGDDTGTILSTDSRLSDGGFSFTLSPDDVDSSITFQCDLITG